MQKWKIYVGCGLTRAPEEFHEFVAEFKWQLGQVPGIEVLEFIGLTAGTPADVYRHDMEQVGACDAMIAFADEHSIGLGMEIREAILNKKPLLCFHRAGTAITRMLLGAQEAGHLSIATYQGINDAVRTAVAFITPPDDLS